METTNVAEIQAARVDREVERLTRLYELARAEGDEQNEIAYEQAILSLTANDEEYWG